MEPSNRSFTAFYRQTRLASGFVRDVVAQTKRHLDEGGEPSVLIFEDQTGMQTEFDFQGSLEEVLARLEADPAYAQGPKEEQPPRPGRPKLGVVSREVSLLPRHWEWLERQPGGLSATLRRLVEIESKASRGLELARNAREAAAKFMWAMAGNLPHFEEASRALYAKDASKLRDLTKGWPADTRDHVERLVQEATRLDKLACP